MLAVRVAQMAVLEQQRERAFRRQLVDHGLTHFPSQFDGLPSAAVQTLAQQIIARAAAHRISTERDISKYFNLSCVFGLAFDEDASLPWAAAILGDERIGATLKINRLYLSALEHETAGRGLHAVPMRGPDHHA